MSHKKRTKNRKKRKILKKRRIKTVSSLRKSSKSVKKVSRIRKKSRLSVPEKAEISHKPKVISYKGIVRTSEKGLQIPKSLKRTLSKSFITWVYAKTKGKKSYKGLINTFVKDKKALQKVRIVYDREQDHEKIRRAYLDKYHIGSRLYLPNRKSFKYKALEKEFYDRKRYIKEKEKKLRKKYDPTIDFQAEDVNEDGWRKIGKAKERKKRISVAQRMIMFSELGTKMSPADKPIVIKRGDSKQLVKGTSYNKLKAKIKSALKQHKAKRFSIALNLEGFKYRKTKGKKSRILDSVAHDTHSFLFGMTAKELSDDKILSSAIGECFVQWCKEFMQGDSPDSVLLHAVVIRAYDINDKKFDEEEVKDEEDKIEELTDDEIEGDFKPEKKRKKISRKNRKRKK